MLSSYAYCEIDVLVQLSTDQERDLFMALERVGVNASSVKEYDSIWRHFGGFIETKVLLSNGMGISCQSNREKQFKCEYVQIEPL